MRPTASSLCPSRASWGGRGGCASHPTPCEAVGLRHCGICVFLLTQNPQRGTLGGRGDLEGYREATAVIPRCCVLFVVEGVECHSPSGGGVGGVGGEEGGAEGLGEMEVMERMTKEPPRVTKVWRRKLC